MPQQYDAATLLQMVGDREYQNVQLANTLLQAQTENARKDKELEQLKARVTELEGAAAVKVAEEITTPAPEPAEEAHAERNHKR